MTEKSIKMRLTSLKIFLKIKAVVDRFFLYLLFKFYTKNLIMKKLLLIFCLFSLISYSQECKFERNSIDEFTKTKIVKTKSKPIVDIFSPTQVVRFQFLFESQSYLLVDITTARDIELTNSFKNSLYLLLDNEEVIKLEIADENNSKTINTMLGNMDAFKHTFSIKIEDLEKLKSVTLKKIRIGNTEKSLDFEVNNAKKQENLKATVNCFLNEIK